MLKEKGFTPLIIILGLVIALGIAGGAYYLGTKKPASSGVSTNSVIPSQTTKSTSAPITKDQTRDWKIYSITPDASLGYASYLLKLPADWKQIEHSSSFPATETFIDAQNLYKLIIKEQINHNDQTGKPFANFKEITGLVYDTPVTVDGHQGTQLLPRAGSEYIYEVLLFSSDTKLVYSIMLSTPSDGSKITEGKVLFDQILSTFKFTDQNQTSIDTNLPAAVRLAKQDLAKKLNVDITQISIEKMEKKDWPDSSLGCPERPLSTYLQVITPGYFLYLKYNQTQYEYHTDLKSNFIQCTQIP